MFLSIPLSSFDFHEKNFWGRIYYMIIKFFAKFHWNLLKKFEVIAYISNWAFLDVHNSAFWTCSFQKSCMQLYWNCTSAWVFSFKFLHIFRIPFPKNTWKAASVSWEINFEQWEKIRLDLDENINITYFFAEE